MMARVDLERFESCKGDEVQTGGQGETGETSCVVVYVWFRREMDVLGILSYSLITRYVEHLGRIRLSVAGATVCLPYLTLSKN